MDLLDAAATEAAMGSSRFKAALHQRSGGRINPYAYTNGLASAAASVGARIFTHSAVTSVRQRGERWVVATGGGNVLAHRVIACTNAYVTEAIPAMTRAFYPGIPAIVSFKPVAASLADALVPSGATLSQLGLPAAVQKDVTGRFYFASIPPLGRAARSEPFARTLGTWLRKTFPQLASVPFEVEAYWSGRTANTLDALPRIHEIGPGFLAPIACNGLGITTCTQFGRVLAEAIHRDRYDELPTRVTPPGRYPLRSLYDPAVGLMVSGMRLRGRMRGALG
jgi:glycine/D-amino acid oxidase-like deaminating enzyme